MMCYDKALHILARMEYPQGSSVATAAAALDGGSSLTYEDWIGRLVERKFCHIVSAQVGLKPQ